MVDQRYRVTVGGYALSEEELGHPSGEQEIRIIPVIGGAGAAGRILAGVALVAASFIPGVGALAVNLMLGVGASLVLGGVAQLISPVPTLDGGDDSQGDPRKSYSFSGIQNTSRQGLPIPIVYGEMIVGSIVVSSSIDSDQD